MANPLTYPKSSEPFDSALFRAPTAEYRGCPLWSWNNKLNRKELLEQIDDFQIMGMGGFHIHSRVGLDTEYLGEDFMDLVKRCVDKAKEKKLLACLYDEDRWPSGCAGGLVVAGEPEYKLQHLLLTPLPYGNLGEIPAPSASGRAARSEGFLVARYRVALNEDGTLAPNSTIMSPNDPSDENTWYAYIEPNPPSEWFNSQTYVDTFSKLAIARFIDITHEKYKSKVGNEFGKVIPSIFTDEPQFSHKTQLQDPRQRQDVFMPWSLDLPETFKNRYDYDLLEKLLETVWDQPAEMGPSTARYHFHDHICERFVEAFMDQISTWCQENSIFLIGHIMKEPFLWSQTDAVGEAMRCYRNLNVPGVDILCDRFEYNTVKQAASVARQNGGRGVMSELYGVTNWTFDFEGHKGSGDWQAALGVTFRVPHLTWASMAGEAKRDYPASIGYQSPWFKEYSYIEDYFARINVILTRGSPLTRVGVIHPIESYWLCRGPVVENFEEQDFREQAFADLTNWLLQGLIDFDFVSESLLPSQISHSSESGGQLKKTLTVGACHYETIIVPNLKTIRSSTLRALKNFAALGGKVIIAGESPIFIDASIPQRLSELEIPESRSIPFTRTDILHALDQQRDLRIVGSNGKHSRHFLYQMRKDENHRFVFICNTERKTGRFTVSSTTISFKGQWQITMLDAFTGEEEAIPAQISPCGGWTNLHHRFDGCSSILLRLSAGLPDFTLPAPLVLAEEYRRSGEVELKSVEMSESNVLLLDYAEYKLETDENWGAMEEVLRIDNIVRTRLGMPLKLEAYKQPWSISQHERKTITRLELRFQILSEIELEVAHLAMEDPESATITLNDHELPTTSSNQWWVDKAIRQLPVRGGIKKGINTLLVKIPFGLLTNIERVYLLGSFGVRLSGRNAALVAEPDTVKFGDWTRQGLPFYAGNITYNCALEAPSPLQPIALCVPRFRTPLLAIAVDGVRKGVMISEPYILELGVLEPGEHSLQILAYGNRFNSFGHLHLPEGASPWCGPLLWRTEDDWWTPEYSIVPMGVLQTPLSMVRGKPKVAFWKEGPTY
ncbi:hypothetical protein N431DRAFT_477990 [Stipitochalara longipes BDJ]|nr:hypothetical protein N431DRAFT_477990 [Stipitochalara longipes BDJ]